MEKSLICWTVLSLEETLLLLVFQYIHVAFKSIMTDYSQ